MENAETGEQNTVTCKWLFCAAGYYRYDQGFTPHFEGRERFRGPIVHPQQWPEDLDYSGKRVVVIRSGSTAVTLIPAMAPAAEHVTMLQRTPSYVLPVPTRDKLNGGLAALLGDELAYAITRRKNISSQVALWRFCQKYPKAARRLIRYLNAELLPTGYPVDEHFNPPYGPWDQRMSSFPTATCSASSATARHLWSPGASSRSPRPACCSKRPCASGRHHRHGYRPERAGARRDDADRRRRAGTRA